LSPDRSGSCTDGGTTRSSPNGYDRRTPTHIAGTRPIVHIRHNIGRLSLNIGRRVRLPISNPPLRRLRAWLVSVQRRAWPALGGRTGKALIWKRCPRASQVRAARSDSNSTRATPERRSRARWRETHDSRIPAVRPVVSPFLFW